MILIANPIYDAVFKYLLEDITIARELLSTILSVDIVDLTVKPQETIVKDEISGEIKIFRLDFKAIVKLADNEYKTVLIELQKAKKSHDISRFRVYLGENYKKGEDYVNDKGEYVDKYTCGLALFELPFFFAAYHLSDFAGYDKMDYFNPIVSVLFSYTG